MSAILVAVIINVIAAGIIVAGIFTGRRDGIRVIGIKALVTLGGGVGIYFLTPVITDGLKTIAGFEDLVVRSFGFTVLNALIMAIGVLICFGIGSIIGSIVKHCIIKNLKKAKSKNAKVRLAKAVNKDSGKKAKIKEKRRLKAEFKAQKRWYTKTISEFIAFVLFVVIAFVIVIPFKYIAQVLVNNDAEKQYLLDGYAYTLNGAIDDLDLGITEFIVRDEVVVSDEEIPAEEEQPDEEVAEEANEEAAEEGAEETFEAVEEGIGGEEE